MIRHIIYVILLLLLIFGLILLSEKIMNKYGSAIAGKFSGNSEKKKLLDFNNINNTCLIIAFVLFMASLVPEINRILFTTMAVIFALRSLRGRMSFFRATWLFIGSFSLGVFISMRGIGNIEPVVFIVLLVIALPMLVLGFK